MHKKEILKMPQTNCTTCLRDNKDECVGCKLFWSRTGCFILLLCAFLVFECAYGIVTYVLGVGSWNLPWPK